MSRSLPQLPVAVLLLVLPVLVGCGDGLPTRLPVTGEVTLDGKPVPDAKITFMPTDGSRAANAMTDSSGKFSSATTFSHGDGVLIGDHLVAITPKEPPPMPGDEISSPGGREARKRYVPAIPDKFGMPKKSGLTAKVDYGSDNHFVFELKSK